MIFNSVTYLLFLPLVVMLYWALPRTPRLWMIFLASIVFYGFWRVEFVVLMLASTMTDYWAALFIHRARRPWRRKAGLLLSLAVNLGLLFYFKYLLFTIDNFQVALNLFGVTWDSPALNIILPLGISFYTFQTISYTVDVYRGFIRPEHDFVLYACYVTFFPQLVAGPILRTHEVVPQLDSPPAFCWADVAEGTRRVLFGLFLKVVLADHLAPLVDDGFAQPAHLLSAWDVMTLAFLFGFQIYFDFSAYSHIALGSARMMGIHFPENFDHPYLATSPRDFWKRWHISLSSWIRDYLYLPLAGATVRDRSTSGLAISAAGGDAPLRANRALFITWTMMGLWHGAAWTFVLWGVMHAAYVYGYRLVKSLGSITLAPRWRALLGWLITLPLAMLAWIPFRAQEMDVTYDMFSQLVSPSAWLWLGLRENNYLVAALILAGLVSSHWIGKLWRFYADHHGPWLVVVVVESTVFTVIISLIFIFLRPVNQFIYFQF